MKNWAVAGLCLISSAAPAWADEPMTGEETRAFISGKTIEFDNGIATYKPDGSYEYHLKSSGMTWPGTWLINQDKVCIRFDNGPSRCDQYVKEGDRIGLMNSRGIVSPVTGVR